MRVIIAGGREFRDYDLLKQKCGKYLCEYAEVTVVSGGAKGADELGQRFAEETGCELKVYPADWDTYGKAAGFIRNKVMAENAEALIAFWDGRSPGTKHMIEEAEKKGLLVRVVRY
jgi:hypothetical protein